MKRYAYSRPSENIAGYSNSPLALSETNDCVVISISSAFQLPYEQSHKFVADKFGRKFRKGTYAFSQTMDRMWFGKECINGKAIKKIDTRYQSNKDGKIVFKDYTVNQFIMKNPKGTFIVTVSGHAFSIKDGVVIGNPEDSVKIKRKLRSAHQIISK